MKIGAPGERAMAADRDAGDIRRALVAEGLNVDKAVLTPAR